jgi:hypothetical protein
MRYEELVDYLIYNEHQHIERDNPNGDKEFTLTQSVLSHILYNQESDEVEYPTLYKFNPEFAKQLLYKTKFNTNINTYPLDFIGAFLMLDQLVFVKLHRSDIPFATVNDKPITAYLESQIVSTIKNFQLTPESRGYTHTLPMETGSDYLENASKKMMECVTEDSDGVFSEDIFNLQMAMILNGIAYISSGKPDLRHYKPPTKDQKLTRRERDKIIQENGNDEAILVSWGWKKPSILSATNYESRGHFWFCPYGPGRSLRKWEWRNGCIKRKEDDDINLEQEKNHT